LGVGPFYDQVCQHLGFDGLAWHIGESLTHELDQPFSDSPYSLPVLDDLSQGKGQDHRNWMAEEVKLELVVHEDNCVESCG